MPDRTPKTGKTYTDNGKYSVDGTTQGAFTVRAVGPNGVCVQNRDTSELSIWKHENLAFAIWDVS